VNRWFRHRGRGCVALLVCVLGAPVPAADVYAFLGREAPDFALHAIAGDNVRLSEHRGDVVVVTFWGSRCSTCRAPLAALDALYATYRSAGLVAVGVGVDDNQARSQEFAQSVRVRFPMLMDPTKGVARDWQVDTLPMTVFIDRSGKVRAVTRDVGRNAEAVYRREIRPLLDE
jgi:peroxiredoxin